jgi:hypothetical protein
MNNVIGRFMANVTFKEMSDVTFISKINDMLSKGEAIPLDLEERSLRIHLRTYPERSDLLQRLCAVLAAQDRVVPLELEERALVALIKIHPERQDLKDRLQIVRVGAGKAEPPPAMVGPSGEEASQIDVNFQEEADSFSSAVNYRDMDPAFASILEQSRRFTMTSVERMYALYKAIEYIEMARIPGAIVECGVWRGGSIMVALATLVMLGKTDREIYLFDTFEGLPRPDDDKDVDILGNRAINGWLPHSRGSEQSNWAYASLDDVRANVATTGYPTKRIHFIKGMVENTLPAQAPDKIALCRLDTDWYASTRHEMNHLYPRLVLGGTLIIDDYGHFRGARDAVDEYLAETRSPLLLHRVDYSGRVGVKIT